MTNRSQANFYTGATLDRAGPSRKQADWLADRLRHPLARLVPVWRGRFLMSDDGAAAQPRFLSPGDEWWQGVAADPPVFLGVDGTVDDPTDADGAVWFTVDVSAIETPEDHPHLSRLGVFTDLRALAPLLDRPTAGLFAYARGLLSWHQKHRFCAACGWPSLADEGGHVRRCGNPDCGQVHFPRTDPAVIMLVRRGDQCLLGRSPRFPPGRYSTLAGFVEPGESLEAAVAREVMEEAGVAVTDVRYHSSQPWPFPASLMMGFTATAVSDRIRIDQDELEDARWFSREEVRTAAPGALPPPDSIARQLIEDWLREG